MRLAGSLIERRFYCWRCEHPPHMARMIALSLDASIDLTWITARLGKYPLIARRLTGYALNGREARGADIMRKPARVIAVTHVISLPDFHR